MNNINLLMKALFACEIVKKALKKAKMIYFISA